MKNFLSTALTLCFAFILFAVSACDEAPTVATEAPAFGAQDNATLSAKPDCSADPSHPSCSDGGGTSDGPAPMYARLVNSGLAEHAGYELVDPDDEGGRLGTGWAAGLDIIWDTNSGEWTRSGGVAAVSPDCPGISFGLIEGNMKKGKVTTVWVRGYDGQSNYSSDKIDVGSQPPSETGWTLDVQQYIDISTGNGQSHSVVCTVYLNQINYALVNP